MDAELKQQVASLAKEANKQAFAEMMVEYINPGHITQDFIGLLLNTRSLNPGDSLVKKVRKGISVHTLVPGSIPLAHEITVTERINYVLDGSIVSATANQWELEAGEIGTVDSIRSEMQAKLRDHFMNKVFTALATIWSSTNTPSNYVAGGSAVTKTVLDAMLETINDTVGAKAIVGTRAALSPILGFAGWTTYSGNTALVDNVAEEVMRTGWLGQYYGVPLVVIKKEYDNPEDYNLLIPSDKILVIGENVGEFITFGEPKFDEYTDKRPVPPQWYLRLYQQYGMLVDNAQGIGVIKLG